MLYGGTCYCNAKYRYSVVAGAIINPGTVYGGICYSETLGTDSLWCCSVNGRLCKAFLCFRAGSARDPVASLTLRRSPQQQAQRTLPLAFPILPAQQSPPRAGPGTLAPGCISGLRAPVPVPTTRSPLCTPE